MGRIIIQDGNGIVRIGQIPQWERRKIWKILQERKDALCPERQQETKEKFSAKGLTIWIR